MRPSLRKVPWLAVILQLGLMLRGNMVHMPHVPMMDITRRLRRRENRAGRSQDPKHGERNNQSFGHDTLLWFLRSAVTGIGRAFAVATRQFG
jgi:hypothetical protein